MNKSFKNLKTIAKGFANKLIEYNESCFWFSYEGKQYVIAYDTDSLCNVIFIDGSDEPSEVDEYDLEMIQDLKKSQDEV